MRKSCQFVLIIFSICAALAPESTLAAGPKPQSHARQMAQSIMSRNPRVYADWDYVTGTVLQGFVELWRKTGDSKYFNYVKNTIDAAVDDQGNILDYKLTDYNLDEISQGRQLLFLYGKTGQIKYKKAAGELRRQLREQPRTPSGGFWHKQRYPHQMWLDGLYMASPFYAEYGKVFNEPENFDDVVRQFSLIEKKTRDPKTGLLYHGWDESRQQSWADSLTGLSACVWARAVGWYAMALVDVLDYLPAGHAGRDSLTQILNRLASALIASQDEATGVWWQIMDQPDRESNYLESSASCMFVYALAKGVRKGYLPRDFYSHARKGYAGVLKQFITIQSDGTISLTHTCISAGLGYGRDGSYDYYVHQAGVRENDGKGLGPFIMASLEMELLPPKGVD